MLTKPEPIRAITVIVRSMNGKVRVRLVRKVRTRSASPPRYPIASPAAIPMVPETSTARALVASETRAP